MEAMELLETTPEARAALRGSPSRMGSPSSPVSITASFGYATPPKSRMTTEERALRAKLRHAFRTFDAERTGALSADELVAMCEGLNLDIASSKLRQLLRAADRDGSGQIPFEDFMAAIHSHKRGDAAEEGLGSVFSGFGDLCSSCFSAFEGMFQTPKSQQQREEPAAEPPQNYGVWDLSCTTHLRRAVCVCRESACARHSSAASHIGLAPRFSYMLRPCLVLPFARSPRQSARRFQATRDPAHCDRISPRADSKTRHKRRPSSRRRAWPPPPRTRHQVESLWPESASCVGALYRARALLRASEQASERVSEVASASPRHRRQCGCEVHRVMNRITVCARFCESV